MSRYLSCFCFLSLLLSIASCSPTADDIEREYTQADSTLLCQLSDTAKYYYDHSLFAESLEATYEAMPIAEALCDTDYICDLLNTQMTAYTRLQLVDSALTVGLRLLELDKLMGDNSYIATDYQTLAAVYLSNQENAKARQYIDLAVRYAEESDDDYCLAGCYGVASEVACAQGMYDEAYSFVHRAYELDSVAQRPLRVARRLTQMADVYAQQRKFSLSAQTYTQAIRLFTQLGELHSLGIACRNLGRLYWVYLKQPAEARPWLEKSIEITSQTGELGIQVDAYKLMAEINEHTDTAEFHRYMALHDQLRDSLVSIEKERALIEFDAKQQVQTRPIFVIGKSPLWVKVLIAIGAVLLCFLGYMLVRSIRHRKRLTLQIADLEEQKAKFLAELEAKAAQSTTTTEDGVAVPEVSEADRDFLSQVTKIIFEQMDSAELSAESIASQLCITSQQLRRRLQAINGMTTSAYINQLRLDFAKQLLAHDAQYSILEIALRCGFEEPNNFSRAFKQKMGVSPTQYRKELKN